MTTTSYGTWASIDPPHSPGAITPPAVPDTSVEDWVTTELGDYAYFTDSTETAAVANDYRAAINAALPDGVQLDGNEFRGHPGKNGGLGLAAVVAGVDFWAVAARHDIVP